MRILFDTSVLVAALVKQHQSHGVCLARLLEIQNGSHQGLICTHSLAELYSVLTRLPYQPQIRPEQAQRLMTENLRNFEKVSLSSTDYERAVALMVTLNLPGGGIFDTIITQAGLKANADALLTLNPRHFVRLGEEVASIVEVPH